MATITQGRRATEPGYYSPRPSTEPDRRYLLASSLASSETSSIFTATDGDRTPRAASPCRNSGDHSPTTTSSGSVQPPTKPPIPTTHHLPENESYRGFPSEAHYLAALQAWAESKKFTDPESGVGLRGFYGETTMEEYAQKPGVRLEGLGLRQKWRERKGRKGGRGERRATVV